jgi:hypothetical protein
MLYFKDCFVWFLARRFGSKTSYPGKNFYSEKTSNSKKEEKNAAA